LNWLRFPAKRCTPVLLFVISGLLAASASATTLTGTITNGTTGKPAAGDKVELIELSQGMQDAGNTTTDAQGRFQFQLPNDGVPHLIRAYDDGVSYNKMATPGTTTIDLTVYDAGKKIAGISVTADVMRLQAQGNELQGIRLFAVDNESSPPRTQMSDKNFEFYLPSGAVVDQGVAMTQGGEPLTTAPDAEAQKNRYSFDFPLRPGTTQFQVVFHMPYNGQASIDPKALYPSQHFVVMLPASMQFSPGPGATFQEMKDPRQSNALVQVVTNAQLGQPLSFRISGTGVLPDESQQGDQQQASTPGGAAQADNRPGGGLGPPEDAPDPLQKSWPYLLAGFVVLLAGGAWYTMKKPQTAAVAGSASEDSVSEVAVAVRPGSSGSSNLLLEALKEELFQLEIEHKQGKVTQAEYEKAKDALDQTLERALKREMVKSS
jgi:hypothetical protein